MDRTAEGRVDRPWTPVAFATAAWSATYAALGFAWAVGSPGFPFGRGGDPSAVITLFPDATAGHGGLVIGVLGSAGVLLAVAMVRMDPRGRAVPWAIGLAAIIALTLIAIVPDYRVLLALAYLPLVILGAPFGWPPGVDVGLILPWHVVNQLVLIAGGALWAGSAIELRRRSREATGRVGADPIGVWLVRAGRPATAVAVAVPLVYAATRYAWALGIPVGLGPEFYEQGQRIGLWTVGAGLATVAVGGAVLTLGLIQGWGVTVPRWLPVVGGRAVPWALAVVPALAAAFVVTSAGLMFVRLVVTGRLPDAFVFARDIGWAAIGPELLWPVWGVSLALAALSYRQRRRSLA